MTECIKPPGQVLTASGWHDVSCKMRNCPVCSKVIRNQLMDRVKIFFSDDQVYFMTLTMQADDRSDIMKHWNLLYKRLKYYYQGIRIFWVKEKTKRGVAHLHAVVNRSIDGSWLSRVWLEITKTSYIVKIDNSSEVMNAAGYMLKYMTKADESVLQYDKGERMYGFLGARAPPKQTLGFEEDPLEFVLGQHFNQGSKYWMQFYNNLQVAYGRPCVEYMSFLTLNTLDRIEVIKHKLNFKTPYGNESLPKVQLLPKVDNDSGQVSRNTTRWNSWKNKLDEILARKDELSKEVK